MSVKSGSTKETFDTSSAKSELDSEEAEADDERNFVLREVPHTETETTCKLCFRPAQNPDSSLKLGPLYEFGYCVAHLYCLMFSAGLDQNGSDDEGINGFLPKDIVKEWRRGSRLLCIYCKGKYATLGCVGKQCKKCYHLPCGLEHGSLQQFFGNYESHCEAHKPVQDPFLLKNKKNVEMFQKNDECGCCTMELEDPDSDEKEEVLWTPCCNGWFHRNCIEKTAENAGTHFFKCPLCNNKEEFTEEMQQFGVHIPDRDANWETARMFDDQLQRHDTCDAVTCTCPGGRKFDEEDTPWEIMLCVCCGAQGIHVECGELDVARPRWKCPMCKPILARMPNDPVSVFTRVKRGNDPPNKEFTRNVLQNLTFRIGQDNVIGVDVHKNRKNPLDPVVVSLKVKGVPALDIPKPVQLKKKAQVSEKDTVENIPCPYDNCEELLSRLEFKTHLSKHREENRSSENNQKEESMEGRVEISNASSDIDYNSPAKVGEEPRVNRVNNVTIDTMELADESVEIVEIKSDESLEIVNTQSVEHSQNKSKQAEKQSSILSFFRRFDPRPKDEVDEIYAKKFKKDLLSPTFKSSPNIKKARKRKAIGSSDKRAPNVVEHLTSLATPSPSVSQREAECREETENKVISSPLGFFKIDQSALINEPRDGSSGGAGGAGDGGELRSGGCPSSSSVPQIRVKDMNCLLQNPSAEHLPSSSVHPLRVRDINSLLEDQSNAAQAVTIGGIADVGPNQQNIWQQNSIPVHSNHPQPKSHLSVIPSSQQLSTNLYFMSSINRLSFPVQQMSYINQQPLRIQHQLTSPNNFVVGQHMPTGLYQQPQDIYFHVNTPHHRINSFTQSRHVIPKEQHQPSHAQNQENYRPYRLYRLDPLNSTAISPNTTGS